MSNINNNNKDDLSLSSSSSDILRARTQLLYNNYYLNHHSQYYNHQSNHHHHHHYNHHSSIHLSKSVSQLCNGSLNSNKLSSLLSNSNSNHNLMSTGQSLYRSNSSLEIHNNNNNNNNNSVDNKQQMMALTLTQSSLTQSSSSTMSSSKRHLFGSAHSIDIKSRTLPSSPITTSNSIQQQQSQQQQSPLSTPKSIRSKLTSSLFRKLRKSTTNDSISSSSVTSTNDDQQTNSQQTSSSFTSYNDRRKYILHYDINSIQSILSPLNSTLLSKRRNTTTGASAANSLLNNNNNNNNNNNVDLDDGDGKSNNLLLSCPFFRNELGNEKEVNILLNYNSNESLNCHNHDVYIHQTSLANRLSILENESTHWKQFKCLLNKSNRYSIESRDDGVYYYRSNFYGLEHENWFGIDEKFGPICISIRRQKSDSNNNNQQSLMEYRIIVRTSELNPLRGTILERMIPSLANHCHQNNNNHHLKEVFDYIFQEINLSKLKLGKSNCDELLLKFDEQKIIKQYKCGILLCLNGQSTEEQMYNNEYNTKDFEEFLLLIGNKVRLKGFNKYKGGLDIKSDTTGLYSIYAQYEDCELMFHVSTLLPFTANNKQQLLRKRHIGNDIVTIIFQDYYSKPFTPSSIRSHFQHIFIIVKLSKDKSYYQVAVTRSNSVPIFGPPIKKQYKKDKEFVNFLLSKIINGENAVYKTDKFVQMAQRTRFEYLKDLFNNYTTNINIDSIHSCSSTSSKLSSILSFNKYNSNNNNNNKPQTTTNTSTQNTSNESHSSQQLSLLSDYDRVLIEGKGCKVWQVLIGIELIDCYLGISYDSLIVINIKTKLIIFACSTKWIIGWNNNEINSELKLFVHQGECLLIKSKDFLDSSCSSSSTSSINNQINNNNVNSGSSSSDDLQEIINRLILVTNGISTETIKLKRNLSGNLGFHINNELIITEVESDSINKSLIIGSKIVQICQIICSTIDYETILDLLKTSSIVTITIIKPIHNNIPRKGCQAFNCPYYNQFPFVKTQPPPPPPPPPQPLPSTTTTATTTTTTTPSSNKYNQTQVKNNSYQHNNNNVNNNNNNLIVNKTTTNSSSTTSTLQENLIKLLSCDSSMTNNHKEDDESNVNDNEIIITKAQPAQVLNNDLDWPSLVDTATRSLQSTQNELDLWISLNEDSYNGQSNVINWSSAQQQQPHQSLDLEAKLIKLQNDLVKEHYQKNELEEQVKLLKEENARLHRESETAAAQLRKFTEWYWSKFNNK